MGVYAQWRGRHAIILISNAMIAILVCIAAALISIRDATAKTQMHAMRDTPTHAHARTHLSLIHI